MNLDHLDEDERGLAGIRRLHNRHRNPPPGPHNRSECTCHGCHVHALCDDVERALELLKVESANAKRALLAEFVPAIDQEGCPTLWAAVLAACAHHGWHHDAADATYVQGVEIARDAALARVAELEEERA
jgi:hypothetical protein